jgi:hypothetical protein
MIMSEMENKNLEQTVVSGEEESNDSADLIKAIKEIKQNSVSREQYEKLQNENKELLDTLINGGQVEMIDPASKPSIEDLRKELFSKEAADKGMTNLEFVSRSLELRDAIIESGGTDPFLPIGKGIELTRDDYEAAEFTAEQFRECIDIAQGNSEVFTAELMRRTVDNSLPTAKKNSNPYRR